MDKRRKKNSKGRRGKFRTGSAHLSCRPSIVFFFPIHKVRATTTTRNNREPFAPLVSLIQQIIFSFFLFSPLCGVSQCFLAFLFNPNSDRKSNARSRALYKCDNAKASSSSFLRRRDKSRITSNTTVCMSEIQANSRIHIVKGFFLMTLSAAWRL